MLKKVKSYIDNHLNPAKKYVDRRKENFVYPLRIPEILAEFQIADDNYHRALLISKDDDFELHLQKWNQG